MKPKQISIKVETNIKEIMETDVGDVTGDKVLMGKVGR